MTTKLEKVLPSNLQFLNASNDVYTLEVGNRTKNTFTYTSTSHSINSTTWAFNTPSDKIVMNRRFILQLKFTAALTAATDWGTGFALRQWAPMSAARNVELTLNGQKSHSLPSEQLFAFGRFNTNEEQRAKFMSGCPSQPDPGEYPDWCRYDCNAVDGSGLPHVIAGAQTCLSTPNTMSPFALETCSDEPSRAWFGYYTQAADATLTRTYTLYCPVFCSPLSWNTSCDGIANVSKVNLRIDWMNSLVDHLFSYTPTPAAVAGSRNTGGAGLNTNNSQIAASSQADIAINWSTSQNLIIEYADPVCDIPPVLAFDHIEIQQDVKRVPTSPVGSGAAFVDVLNTTQFMDIVPACVYVYVRETVGDMRITSADTFAGLNRLTVRYNNIDYQYTEEQMNTLWAMSVNNGLDVPYASWNTVSTAQRHKVGSIVCLQFGKDIPLPAGVFPGSPLKSSLMIRVSGVNMSGVAKNLDLYTVISYNARYIIQPNLANIVQGITNDEQAQLVDAPIGEGESQNPHQIVGGGLLGRNHKFLRKMTAVARHLLENKAQIRGAVHAARDAVGMARNVAHGAVQSYQAGGMVGGYY